VEFVSQLIICSQTEKKKQKALSNWPAAWPDSYRLLSSM